MKRSWFSVLQRVGQSLMIPVSVLPAAGLLVALGRVMQSAAEKGSHPFVKVLGDLAYSGGLAIFEQLPVVFAVGVAIGFTGGAGVAALAAVVGCFTMANVLTVMGTALALSVKIQTGVFGGILIGLLSAALYNRFQNTQLHPVLGFFSGKRLVPILAAGTALATGVLLSFLWPPVQIQIEHFGVWIMGTEVGPAFYAAGKRLLIPLGLHHVFYPPFLFQFGEFTTANGTVVTGEAARYFAGDPTAGRFMAAEYPLMLFGLPAAAYAMYLRADLSQRKAVGGVMLAAALTSMITGITEPIEFAFIFVAPLLFVFHVIAAFGSGLLTSLFEIHLGYTFSASLIDFFLGMFNQKNSFWLFTVVGPLIALLYFSVFYTLIGVFQFATPGRQKPGAVLNTEAISSPTPKTSGGLDEKAILVLEALGGASNLVHVDACITRLRLEVKDNVKVNEAELKKLGAAGLIKVGANGVQVIFGVQSDLLKDQIRQLLKQDELEAFLRAPLSGRVMALDQIPDPTFSQGLMGPGFAIDPSENFVASPADATVANLFPTGHAIGLITDSGAEILIHVGLDTVKMKGEGFLPLVKVGDRVKAGQKLIEFSKEKITQAGYSTVTPVVLTNADLFRLNLSWKESEVSAGTPVGELTKFVEG